MTETIEQQIYIIIVYNQHNKRLFLNIYKLSVEAYILYMILIKFYTILFNYIRTKIK